MPQLDVTSVLTDPLFVDNSLLCIRSTQSIGDDGIAVYATQNFPFVGVVLPERWREANRDAEGTRMSGSIKIYTKFRLEDGHMNSIADLVQYKDRQYTVVEIKPYNFAAGFVLATCDLLSIPGARGN